MGNDGLTHEEFMALSGMAQMPAIPDSSKPLPVIYDQAVKAIAACLNIDEAKYWDNKADALAAWAKIYANDEVARQARSLKLHAYRRIGILAGEIRQWRPAGRGLGSIGGARTVLIENGFSKTNACLITKLASTDETKFNDLANSKKPPSPSVMVGEMLRPNPVFAKVSSRLRQLRSGVKNVRKLISIQSLNEKELRVFEKVIGEVMQESLEIAETIDSCLNPSVKKTA